MPTFPHYQQLDQMGCGPTAFDVYEKQNAHKKTEKTTTNNVVGNVFVADPSGGLLKYTAEKFCQK